MTNSSHSPRVRRQWRARHELIDVSRSTQSAAAERLYESTRRAALFYPLVACSSAVATAGLVLDDDTTRLLAVLLAPVMTPVLGIALGVATGNTRLLGRSLLRGAAATVVALATAFVVAHSIPHEPLRDALIAHTSLRPAHLVVAFAVGVAATLGFRERQLPVAIPGTLLTVLTLLPMVTLGVAISDGEGSASAAWLQVCASVALLLLGSVAAFVAVGCRYRGPIEELPFGMLVRRFGPSALALVVLSAVATNVTTRVSRAHATDLTMRRLISTTLRANAGARLLGTTLGAMGDDVSVIASVAAPATVTAREVAHLEDSLRAVVGERVHLTVRSLLTQDVDRSGLRLTATVPSVERTPRDDTLFLDRAASALRAMTVTWPGFSLEGIGQERRHGAHIVTAVVRTPRVVSAPEVDELERELMRRLEEPIALIVRSVVSIDAYSSGDADESSALGGIGSPATRPP